MKTIQNAVLSALMRAQAFLLEYLAQLAGIDLTAIRKRLDDAIASFAAHAVDQNTSDRDTRGESAKQQQLRLQLSTDLMRPIAEIARHDLRTTPEFKALQMPRQRLGGPAFAASARGMAEAAALHKDTLIARGLPADFLEQFEAGVSQLEASVAGREKSRTRRIGATKGLLLQQQEGRSVLKVLDAVMGKALRGDPVLLAVWKGARAIHRRPGAVAAKTQPSTTQATPTTPNAQPTNNTQTVSEATAA